MLEHALVLDLIGAGLTPINPGRRHHHSQEQVAALLRRFRQGRGAVCRVATGSGGGLCAAIAKLASAAPEHPERVSRQPFMMRQNGACARRSLDHPQPEERVIEPAQLDDRFRPSPRFPPGKGRGSCSWTGVASPRR